VTEDERAYATDWATVEVQIVKRGRLYELNIGRVHPDGDQEIFTLPLTMAQTETLRPIWFPHGE